MNIVKGLEDKMYGKKMKSLGLYRPGEASWQPIASLKKSKGEAMISPL